MKLYFDELDAQVAKMSLLIENGAKSWTRIKKNIVVLSLHFKMEDDKDNSMVRLIRAPPSTTL
jgi:hypothetical protein